MNFHKAILVTGGAGFIGSHLSKRLLELGHDVVIIDNFNDYYSPRLKRRRISDFIPNQSNIYIYEFDIASIGQEEFAQIIKKHDVTLVYHLAAQAGIRDSLTNPFVYAHSNLLGTVHILEAMRRSSIDRIIFASSSSVYGNNTIPFREDDKTDQPLSLYSATKKSTEHLVYSYHSMFGLRALGFRFFSVYGPWGRPDMAPFIFTERIIENKLIDIYGNGEMQRDFTYIDDIISSLIKAMNIDFSWDIINIGAGKPIPLLTFLHLLEVNLGREAKRNYLPMQIGDMPITYADIRKARELLGWSPSISIDEGIKHFIDWYRYYYRHVNAFVKG